MGLLSSLDTIKELGKLRNGEKATLSVADIVNTITNMPDAKKNLTKEEFAEVYELYNKLTKIDIKIKIVSEQYLNLTKRIIMAFDKIAPYDKYCGSNKEDYAIMLQDFRSQKLDNRILKELVHLYSIYRVDYEPYVEYLTEKPIRCISIPVIYAKAFAGILVVDMVLGKEAALNKFNAFVNYLIDILSNGLDENPINTRCCISIFCGALVPNGILSKDECRELSEFYSELFSLVEWSS